MTRGGKVGAMRRAAVGRGKTAWMSGRPRVSQNRPIACFNCGGPHYARECPTVVRGPIKCYQCGGPHFARVCQATMLDQMLRAGIIRPSTSPWESPVTLVPKKDFCVDLHQLNAVTQKDAHPIPKFQDVFDMLGKATVSTCVRRTGS